MTFNWGHKLVLVFLVFGSGMSYLVYRCVKTNYDLVSKEYYKDELAYQQVIDGTYKANLLSSKVQVIQNEKSIVLQFPAEMKKEVVSGSAWFYCPVDAKKDKKIVLAVADGKQEITREQFAAGKYLVKLSWNTGNQHYYSEQPLTIP